MRLRIQRLAGDTRLVTCALVVFAFIVFNANGREIPSYDSQPAKYLAIEIAAHRSLRLDAIVAKIPQLAERPGFVRDKNGHYRTAYPLPSPLIAGGIAWCLSMIGILDLEAPLAAPFVAKFTASALAALTAAFVFVLARRRLTLVESLLLAAGFGFGTNVWSAVSQTLWQQEAAFLALVLGILLLDAPKLSKMQICLIGSLFGIGLWARPQLAPTISVLACWTVFRFRCQAVYIFVPAVAITAVMVMINVRWFGHPLGAVPILEGLHAQVHAVQGSIAAAPWKGAAGLLISPSRGLLVFSPIVVIALMGFFGPDGRRPLVGWCGAAAAAQLMLYSVYSVWWAGHTYGPRYALDTLPTLVPAAAAGVLQLRGRPVRTCVATAAFVWSVATAAAGAFIYPAERWNTSPLDVDRNHYRLWDWRDSQLIRVAHTGLSPQNFALFSRAAIRKTNN